MNKPASTFCLPSRAAFGMALASRAAFGMALASRAAFGMALAALGVACSPTVQSIAVDPAQTVLRARDQSVTLKADPKDKDGKVVMEAIGKLSWSSNQPELARVDDKGTVTALKSGSATIQVRVGEVVGSAQVNVSIPASMTLEPQKTELVGVGKSAGLTAKVMDDAGREIQGLTLQWVSSDANVVSVSEGTVRAVGPGSALVKALFGELNATVEVVVSFPPVASMSIDPPTLVLDKVGDAMRLRADLKDSAGQPIPGLNPKYTVADPRIATVSGEGQVHAAKKGKTTVTAEIDGQSFTVPVEVR